MQWDAAARMKRQGLGITSNEGVFHCNILKNYATPAVAGVAVLAALFLLLFLLRRNEPDRPLFDFRRPHQFTDGVDEAGNGLVVRFKLMLQLVELRRQFLVRREQLAQFHERAHHIQTDFHGALRIQHRRYHQRTVLGKCIGQSLGEFELGKVVTVCDHLILLGLAELKHELEREARYYA